MFVKNGHFIAVYVDDLLIFGPNETFIATIKAALAARFKMVDMGPAKYYLGMQILRDRSRRILQLFQTGYIDQLLRRFGMADANLVDVPMDPKHKLGPASEDH